MFAIIGAILILAVVVMTIMVACGLPLGEFTMGGQSKVLPKKLRLMAILFILIQVFAMFIILQAGEFLPLLFSAEATKYICIGFAAYLSLNTVMNFLSKSKKEKYVITPLSLCAAICFWVTAFQI
ncbi:MAG TPA: hypothetical protein VJY54_05695 [Lachnospiraceae bacterium]|nr:hypothetical protein [Lachnospiraceae bacterium]